LYDTLGDKDAFEESAVKLKAKEAQLKNYVDTHNSLTRRKNREQVVGFDKRISAEAIGANKRAQTIGKMANAKNSMDWSDAKPIVVSQKDKTEIISYAKEKNVNIVDLSKFDGDKNLLKAEIDSLSKVMEEYPEASRRKITLTVGYLPDDDFAQTTNRTITLNANALRNKQITEQNIKKAGIFASPKAEHIVVHEFGHILSSVKGNRGIEITKKAYYNIVKENISVSEALSYLADHISNYAVKYNGNIAEDILTGRVRENKYQEIISEVLSRDNFRSSKFTRAFLKILKEM